MAAVAGKSRVVPARPRPRPVPWLAGALLMAVAWVSAIGLQPLQDRAAFAQYAVVDQRLYMPFYVGLALLAAAVWWLRPTYPARLFDPWLVAFLCWAGFTVIVSPVPTKALVDWGKQVAYFLGLAALVVTFRTQRSLVRVLGWTLLAFVVADLIAVWVRPDVAVHHANDAVEPTLAGLWRGLHPHKAKFGELLAFAVLLMLALSRERRRRWLRLLVVPLLVLMLLAGAKTSLLALALSLVLLAALREAARRAPGLLATIAVVPFAVLIAVAAALLLPVLLTGVFGDATLAGRTHLWGVLWRYAGAHALFGSGYASFFLGEDGPLFRSGDPMLMRTGNAHNSFLDLLVTTGWPGAVLGYAALLLVPIATAYRRLPRDRFAQMWVAVILFAGISSLTSVTLLQNERASGLMLTLGYFALRQFTPAGYAVPPIGARRRRSRRTQAEASA